MEEYKYFGVDLVPKIFEFLLIELFDGTQFERTKAIEDIKKYHQEKGGILSNKDYVSIFKKASHSLQKNGLKKISYGIWRLNYKDNSINIVQNNEKESINYISDKTIGSGNNFLYVYYYDIYKKYAIEKNKTSWECKIGRSNKDPLQRILGQSGTSFPEVPHIGLIINCDDSNFLESAIHSILKYQGKWIESAPGVEWFLTSPNEVENLFYMISKK